jgi:hypothetical protein
MRLAQTILGMEEMGLGTQSVVIGQGLGAAANHGHENPVTYR